MRFAHSSRQGVPTLADTDLVLTEILEELRRIRQVLERDRRPSTLTRVDRAALGRLLPVLGAEFGSEAFTASEVLETDAPALRLVTSGVSAKQLGRLLLRAIGVPLDGLVVERAGVELHRTLWRIVATV
jgi:hypothetical protein